MDELLGGGKRNGEQSCRPSRCRGIRMRVGGIVGGCKRKGHGDKNWGARP